MSAPCTQEEFLQSWISFGNPRIFVSIAKWKLINVGDRDKTLISKEFINVRRSTWAESSPHQALAHVEYQKICHIQLHTCDELQRLSKLRWQLFIITSNHIISRENEPSSSRWLLQEHEDWSTYPHHLLDGFCKKEMCPIKCKYIIDEAFNTL